MTQLYNRPGLLVGAKRVALSALLGVGAMGVAQAQFYAAANVANTTSTYTDLGNTGTAIATANTDDANSAATPIGFTFTYNGTAFTDFVLNTNGFVKLGTAAPTGAQYTDGGQSIINGPIDGAETNLILPFNQDLGPGSAGGTEYRVLTTGTAPNRVCTIQWKNVADKARGAIGTQYANCSFQAKLYETSNQIDFVYGTATPGAVAADIAKFCVVGLKASSTTASVLGTKASTVAWSVTSFIIGPYSGNAHNVRGTMLPDPGRTYRFVIPVAANDLAVSEIQGYGSVAVPAGNPVSLRAVVVNAGTVATAPRLVTLNITGANTATQTQPVATLAVGATAVVTFTGLSLTNTGANTVTVTVPNDDDNTNNAMAQAMATSASRFSVIAPGAGLAGFNGVGSSLFTSSRALCVKFTVNTPCDVTAVRAFIVNDPSLVTQSATVFGVVLNVTTGAVYARSPDYVLTTADLGQLHTFNLGGRVPAGDFLVGLAQVRQAGAPAFFPLGSQRESPSRSDLYYFADIISSGTPVPPTTLVAGGGNGAATTRLMLEAETSVVLATSAALRRAVSVYPNPSNTGQFNLEIHGANAASLGVEVTNLLGQRVYTGTAKDNLRTTVDLSGLTSGIYTLKVRNGQEYTQQQISIVK